MNLTTAQQQLLATAIDHHSGWIVGAVDAQAVISRLARLGLIYVGHGVARVTPAAYTALGRTCAVGDGTCAVGALSPLTQMLDLLRDQGATRAQIRALTGWPARDVNKLLEETARRFGVTLASSGRGITRVYHILWQPVGTVTFRMTTLEPRVTQRQVVYDEYSDGRFVASQRGI